MNKIHKKFKKVKTNVVQSMNSKEINNYIKIISENLSSLISKDKNTLIKENYNGKYENAYDLIPNDNNDNDNNNHILFLALITFHHKQGGVIECTFPDKETILASDKLNSLIDNNNNKINSNNLVLDYILNKIINYSLIDGIHLVNDDSSFFIIHDFPKILYCYSYYIQKITDNKDNDIKDDFQENIRGCIQKAICLVSALPLFGNTITYENYITHLSTQMTLYMDQKSLNDKTVLNKIYDQIEDDFYQERQWMFNIKKALAILREDSLTILKLIILEKRIIVFSQIPSNASLFIMTLLSFFPGNYSNGRSCYDKQNGTPFKLLHEKYLIYPLFTLFDLDSLLDKINNNDEVNYIIGTTNNMVMNNKKLNYHCLINMDEQKIQYGENVNENIKALNGKEQKILLSIFDLLNQKISAENENINSNNSINNKIIIDEPWIIPYDNGNNSNLFYLIKNYIRFYYQRIIFDVSYLVYKMRINDTYDKFVDFHKNINKNYLKITSKEIPSPKEIINNDNALEKDEEENLPFLEELLADPLSFVMYTTLPIKLDYFPNSDRNKLPIEKKRESILIKLNNLAFLSEWTKVRNFKKWFYSYNEQIMYYSTLNTKTAYVSLYDYNDNFYKGSMFLGKKNGTGEFHYKFEQMIYNGEYKNDLREGKGKLASLDGTYLYVGYWHENKMEGSGILNSSNIGRYEGEFHKDCFEGKGKLVDLEKNIYEGMFHKGKKKGKGELKFSNGNIYIGDFKHNKFNGKGILQDSNGNILQEGDFKDGNLIKSKRLNYRNSKDNVNINAKNKSSKDLNINPLHESEELKYHELQQNDSIDEDEIEEGEKQNISD
jgi:hypothetical protein